MKDDWERRTRALRMLLGLLAVLVIPVAGPAQTTPSEEPLPDLSIAYLSLNPRYPAYNVREIEGVPTLADPDTGRALTSAEAGKIQRWPKSGEEVTATARIVNHGTAPSGAFRYTWSLNGKSVAEGRHEGLAHGTRAEGESSPAQIGSVTLQEVPLRPGTYADLTLPFKWKPKQRLRLEVKLEDTVARERPVAMPEEAGVAVPDNNRREERTDSLAILITVPRSAYNTWAALRRPDRPPGFEDWIQGQFELVRGRFQSSVYAEAPQGVEHPLRIDQIRIVENGDVDPALSAAVRVSGWDGVWSYPALRKPAEDAAAPAGEPDDVLSRDLLRILGVVDLSVLTVFPEGVKARSRTGQPLLTGFVHPSLLPTASTMAEHTVLGLNRSAGKRRGFSGTYLYDLPRASRLRVLDNNGRPVPDAEVTVWQKQDGVVGPDPLFTGKTNPEGSVPLPNQPVPEVHTEDGFTLRENPFGRVRPNGENGLLLVSVTARERTELHWLPITSFNLAAWLGQPRQASFDLRTHFPAPRAPAAPVAVEVQAPPGAGPPGVRLRWRRAASGDVAGYFLYRGRYPTYQWERIGSAPPLRTDYFDPIADEHPVRYAVTAVDLEGNESAFSGVTAGAR